MQTSEDQPRLSIVIPTLEASAHLPNTLRALEEGARTLRGELVIVDGGSRDRTRALAKSVGARVLESPPGRGTQLRKGAALARGEWLLFLHADTRPVEGWIGELRAIMDDPGARTRAYAFKLRFDDASAGARRIEKLAQWRARHLGLPYGDQGLVLHRELYEEVGGYPDQPIMEDVALVRRIGKRRLAILDTAAITSAERYRSDGWWLRPARNIALVSLYLLGMPPRLIARLYA